MHLVVEVVAGRAAGVADVADDVAPADLLARGNYPILLGLRDEEIQELQKDGFPIKMVMHLPEILDQVTAGAGMLGIVKDAAHPNAAKLFVNWAMTKDGQEILTKYGGGASVRSDVDKSHVSPYQIPEAGREYLDRSDFQFSMNDRLPLSSRVKELHSTSLELLEAQTNLALDILRDHMEGECSQIPYRTISILGAGVLYFTDDVGLIPNFLPHVGRLDDAAVMATAFELAHSGIERYCDANDRQVPHPHPSSHEGRLPR